MKYSLKQMLRYVPQLVAIPTTELVDRIWQSIAEVEHVEDMAKKFEGIIVSRVISIEKHPKSEKLLIAVVDTGEKETKTVITGAHNFVVGDYLPYIPVGGVVPSFVDENGNPVVIQVRNMVGIPSEGMLASERELGISDDHEGIMILREDELRVPLVPGMPFAVATEYDDTIIEIENKTLTHRGDCFSAAGLAREVATLFSFEYHEPEWQTPTYKATEIFGDAFDKDMPAQLSISIKAESAVDRYSALVLDGITVKPSPQWLRLFLAKHGVNPVNSVVDVTNYVMLDYGQPMHAFDAATISHKKRDGKLTYSIVVRNALSGEKLVTLDGKDRVLSAGVTVIADATNPLALAGVIGGEQSGISQTTTRMILESAVFDKYSIRRTSMEQGIVTDASVVFSRKQDSEKTGRALLRAVHLLQEMAGAIISSPIADVVVRKPERNTIVVSHSKLESFIGIAVAPGRVDSILEGLGFGVQRKGDLFSVMVPSWRPDVSIDEDIYEEVARMIGYEKIVPELPKRGIFGVSFKKYEQVKQVVMNNLVGLGLLQTLNFSFVSKALYDHCQIPMTQARAVVNAISPDVQYMRKHISPALIAQLSRNQYVSDRFALFEIGKVSRKDYSYVSLADDATTAQPLFGIDELGLPVEEQHLALGVVETIEQPAFFVAKKIITELYSRLGITIKAIHPDNLGKKVKLPLWMQEMSQFYKQGRVAVLVVDNIVVGILGEPSSFVTREFGFTKQVAIAELDFGFIQQHALLHPVYREPSRYPTITEDYCFECASDTLYCDVENVYQKLVREYEQKGLQITVSPRDIYAKESAKKQITHRVVYAHPQEAVTDSQVAGFKHALITKMKELGAKIL